MRSACLVEIVGNMTTEAPWTAELQGLEPLFHRLAPGADRQTNDTLLDPTFFEVGASGSVYSRQHVLDVVWERYVNGVDPDDTAWIIEDFKASELAGDFYLVTYRLSFAGRLSRRSTLWHRHESGWKAAYHQGTTCQTEPAPPDTLSRPARTG